MRVKQNARVSVKLALLAIISASLMGQTRPARADDTPTQTVDGSEPPAVTADSNNSNGSDVLPDIEAKMRHLKVIKSSTSKRVYLFELTPQASASPAPSDGATANGDPASNGAASTDDKPPENKLLLLRNGAENVMALRVLRDIAGTNQVIAKRIKQYSGHPTLDDGSEFDAIEKLSDVAPPPPTAQDKADMAEVEPAPLAFDPELDTGSSPSPDDADDEEKEEDHLGASIEEKIVPFEKGRHWIMTSFGLLRNSPLDPGTDYRLYMGGGIRYGYDLIRRVFTTRDERLDTLTIEGGIYFYSVAGVNSSNTTDGSSDSYNIVPISVTARYTYYINENFGWFMYGGILKNNVMSSVNGTDTTIANLSQADPALGLGMLLRVGPQWYARIDTGLDMIAANLVIRF